jgi:transcriptional regulator with XRE-family HTH domain
VNAIKELMLRNNVQQKELAIAIGVSQPTISDWVKGKKKPAGDNITKLATFFQVPEDVIKGLDPLQTNDVTVHMPNIPTSNHRHSGLADKLLSEILGEEEDINAFLESIRHDPERKKLFKRSGKSGIDEVSEANAIMDAIKQTRDSK